MMLEKRFAGGYEARCKPEVRMHEEKASAVTWKHLFIAHRDVNNALVPQSRIWSMFASVSDAINARHRSKRWVLAGIKR
jgi:hypothetical protein